MSGLAGRKSAIYFEAIGSDKCTSSVVGSHRCFSEFALDEAETIELKWRKRVFEQLR
jgi:hypothetical protein